MFEAKFQRECDRKILNLKRIMEIPVETRNVAEEAFPKCNSYISLRDGLGTNFEDDLIGDPYPNLEQPPESPARLAMVTLMQYMDNSLDPQTA